MSKKIDGLTIVDEEVQYGVEYVNSVDGETWQLPCNSEAEAYMYAQLLSGQVIFCAQWRSGWAVVENA